MSNNTNIRQVKDLNYFFLVMYLNSVRVQGKYTVNNILCTYHVICLTDTEI